MSKARIVLAEDHAMIAEGIGQFLGNSFEIVNVVADGQALLQAVRKEVPDLVLADISLPTLNGLEATRQIKQQFPAIRVVILTMHTDPLLVKDAIEAGASGFIIKESAASELVYALHEVLQDRIYLSPAVAQLCDGSLFPDDKDDYEISLTPRQREILQLIAEGQSNKEIASTLQLAIKTVEFHKTRIMRTLGIHSVPELTKFAIAHRIITL